MKRLLIAVITASFLVGACTTMPHTEGPHAQLLPGFDEPRSLDSIELTIHKGTLGETIQACAMLQARHNAAVAALLMVSGSVMYSCAHVKRKSCTVYVVDGWEDTLEHELRHCQGWDHPKHEHEERAL